MKMIQRTVVGIGSLALFLTASSHADEPSFSIITPKATKTFTRSQLVALAEKEPFVTQQDPTYKHQAMTYQVVSVARLFEGLDIRLDSILQFRCLDGFSAGLTTERLLNQDPNGAVAYVAIEDPAHKWPTIPSSQSTTSAGPFYLVWKNPDLSKIGAEEWPFQLAAFQVKPPLKESFPHIFPDPKLAVFHPVNLGFKVFTKNCFACHTLNRNGESQIGPDLNVPYNPTEYLKPKFLRMHIRNPQAMRHFPQTKMMPFSEKDLSEDDLTNLIEYLKHMAKRKI